MNPIILSALTTAIASILASFAVKVGWDATTTLGVAGAIAAGIVAFAVGAWKAMQHSQNAVIKAAADAIATGDTIVTTPEVANGVFKSVPNVVSVAPAPNP